jgi:hypothetical protein
LAKKTEAAALVGELVAAGAWDPFKEPGWRVDCEVVGHLPGRVAGEEPADEVRGGFGW